MSEEHVAWKVFDYFCVDVIALFVLLIVSYVIIHPVKSGSFVLFAFVFCVASALLGLVLYKVYEHVLP